MYYWHTVSVSLSFTFTETCSRNMIWTSSALSLYDS